jgi:hypothetical protein
MKNLSIILILFSLTLMGCSKENPTPNEGAKVYAVNFEQSSENPPTMVELDNSIGAIQWNYVSPGVYHGKLAGAFPLDKTLILCNNGTNGLISCDLRHWDPDFVELRTFSGINEFGDPQPSNGCGGMGFEINVYD